MPPKHREITVTAVVENTATVQNIVQSKATAHIEDAGTIQKLLIAVEEVFVNICRYAYGGSPGPVIINISWKSEFRVTLRDRGKAFDPLRIKAPDLTIPAENRRIGGLGILMVREYMRDVIYEHDGEWNALTLIP